MPRLRTGLHSVPSCPDRALADAVAWKGGPARGRVLWITGLSGVGKTTLAASVHARLGSLNLPVTWLDGDALRRYFGAENTHMNASERLELAMRYSSLAARLARSGAWVVVSTISLFHRIHEINRKRAREYDTGYLEIWLRADERLRQFRAGAWKAGPRVGQELPAQMPLEPNLILDNDDSPATMRCLTNRVILACR